MCGAAGSGKSTYAHRLGEAGYTVLSFDIEAWRRGFRTHPVPVEGRREVHETLQRRLLEAVDDGRPVVVDTSFWSRASRDEYRELLASRGVVPVVHYMATPRHAILESLARRRTAGPDDIAVPVEQALSYMDGLQVPTAEEGPLRVIGEA
ncbi:ATP-binding protein [Cellulomonas triticagri]|uniref:ATP-binding protein n=2 Tax=Cellulomonas triticagri TaxID=2483352 RepID=A0A3M2JGB8_9CELL|nr:ATP-binding protein [Cellulomonas triticagri]